MIGRSDPRNVAAPRGTDDALDAWLTARAIFSWRETLSDEQRALTLLRGAVDGHRRFITVFDAMRDPRRAACMRAALDAVRFDALDHLRLTPERLRRWQRLVLDADDVPFRSRTAFAKGGRERMRPFAVDELARFLADAEDEEVPVLARACRAYLDVCFFHPFDDGNARGARLAFDFVLTRAGVLLDEVGPLFVLPRRPDGAFDFLRTAVLIAAGMPRRALLHRRPQERT